MAKKIAEGFKGEKAIVMPFNIRNQLAENVVARQLYVTHIGYYPHARHHYRERSEGCDENILIYCAEGKGIICCNDQDYHLTRDTAFIIPAHATHVYQADRKDPWSIYWIHFCGENVNVFSSIIETIIHVEESDKSRYKDRFMLFEEMYQNLEMGYSPDNLEYVSFCLLHFMASLKYIEQYREVGKVKGDDTIRKIIGYMKDNIEENLKLKDLASHVGLSPSHFGEVFQRKTSYPPMTYYHQLKIQRACSYLTFSDSPIKEIANKLGYYDQYHFSKAFRAEMGMSPREYKRRHCS